MPALPSEHQFPRRIARDPWKFSAMARNPSSLAPYPADVLKPPPFVPPGLTDLSWAERELLESVLADCNADEPRLRYAEYFDRCGDSRGEFIREQLRDPESPRAAELLMRHGDDWRAPFRPWSMADLAYRRGFVESASVAGRAFISLGEGIFRRAPIREIRLVAIAPYIHELAECPHLSRLESLSLRHNRIDAAGLCRLLSSPYLGDIRELDLRYNALDESAAKALADRVQFPRLAVVRLTRSDVALTGATAIECRFGTAAIWE